MEIRLFGLAERSPEGFQEIDPSFTELPSSPIILYADSQEQALACLGRNSSDTRGVVVVQGDYFNSSPLNGRFWLLEIPSGLNSEIQEIASCFLDTFGCDYISMADSYESLQDRILNLLMHAVESGRNEENLRKSEAQLRQIHSLANIGSWKWHPVTGRFTLSPELRGIYAIQPDRRYPNIEGFVTEFTHPDDIDCLKETLSSVSQGKEARPVTFRIIRPTGEIRWIAAPRPEVISSGEDGRPLEILGIQQDITDRKRAEEDLMHSEMKLQEAARNMPGAIFQFYIRKSGDYGIDFVSGDLEKVFGKLDGSGNLFDSLVGGIPYSEDRDRFYASIDRAVSNVADWSFETRFRKSTGDIIYLRGLSRPILLDDELLYNGVLLDVTDQRRAVERIEHLNSLLLAIRNVNQLIVQEQSIDDLMRKACNTLIETRSYQDCTVALLDGEAGIGKLFQAGERSYPKMEMLSDKLPKCIARVLKTGEYVVREKREQCSGCRFLGSHGEDFHPTFVAPIRSESGTAGVLFVALTSGAAIDEEECGLLQEVAMDLAYAMEKLRSEEQLVRSELRYRTLFDSSKDAIMTLEPPSWKFTSGNPAIRDLFGVSSEEEFTSMEPWRLSPEFQPDGSSSETKAREMIDKAMEEGSNYFQWTHRRVTGEDFQATVLLARVEMKDHTFLQATVRDITGQKAMEEELQRNEQKIRDMANSVPGVLYQFYADAQGRYGLYFVSGRASDILGISPETEGFFDRFVDRVPPGDRGAFLESVETAVREKKRWEHTTPFLRPSGELIWLKGISRPTVFDEETVFNGVFIDITELIDAENALREERDYSASIIRGTPAIVCGISPEGITNFINPSGEMVTGYRSGEIVGRSWWKVFYPGEEYRQVERLFRRFSDEGDVRDYEMTLTTRTGEKRIISWNSINRLDENNSIAEIIGFGFDVTEKKKAESDLRESEKLFRSVVENAPAGIFLVDTDYRIIYSNDQLCRISGYTIDEIMGMDFRDVLDEESRDKVIDRYRRRQQGEEIEDHYEIGVYRKDGERRHVMIYVDHFRDADGNPRTLGEIIDVTERREAEMELSRLRNYMANIIDSMPSVLIGVSREGRVTLWNSGARHRTGIDSDSAFGRELGEVVPWLGRYRSLITESIDSRKVRYQSKQNTSTEEKSRYEDLTVYPLVADHVEGAVIRLDDVTEKVHMEEMMVQSEKMLSVGGLAAGMAHEINNPLAGMMQNAEVIIRRLLSDIPDNDRIASEVGTTMEAVREFLEKRNIIRQLRLIHDSGRRAAMIVQNMLSFARKSEAKPAMTDLRELLDRTLELAQNDYDLKKKYDFKHVDIEREYDPDIPSILCERSKIQQVFLNILRNGTEAMHESRFRTGRPERSHFILRIRMEPPHIVTEIEDNGPGIPEGLRTRVFEPFFTTKDVGIGTGLGLSVSYFIVCEDHKGELEVESVPGRYTRFIIRLPMEPDTDHGNE
ncbi:MAG: PAS domain S-box protein [Candidatus Fermentibacteraceae bacterium]|nr:PAS domain S-box protein [Candidatus Fermentibacteraceae bacterium]MBN2608115.1 PAS domain S-box protein [Candidatus Fermentibacteraceae bacterium]